MHTVAGQFSSNSLVWKVGMSEWVRADSVDELKSLFNMTMPPIPQNERLDMKRLYVIGNVFNINRNLHTGLIILWII